MMTTEGSQNIIFKLYYFFVHGIWEVALDSVSKPKALMIKFLRLIYLLGVEMTEGQLTLRAMGLVYTTLLSFVPLLAVTFSVLSAFGIDAIERTLFRLLAPLGQKASEITAHIIEFVDNMKVGVLGFVGLAILIYTVISVIKKIEDAFNYIWKTKTSRTFFRRFSDYMSVILVGPVLMYSAIGITASMKSTTIVQRIAAIEGFGLLITYAFRVMPYLFVWIAFIFIYIFIPNTKVNLKSALIGGITAGLLWQTAGWGFATFAVSSVQTNAVYSSFAILYLFIFWLFVSWNIVLLGAKIAFYHQFPHFLCAKEEMLLSNRQKEKIAFFIIFLIAYNFYHNKPSWTLDSLVKEFCITPEPINQVIMLLEKQGLIAETSDEPPRYLPARDIETMRLQEIFNDIRQAGENSLILAQVKPPLSNVDGIMKKIDDAIEESLNEETLKGLVTAKIEET